MNNATGELVEKSISIQLNRYYSGQFAVSNTGRLFTMVQRRKLQVAYNTSIMCKILV